MKSVIPRKVTTGTREWSDVSHNIGQKCSHDCKYCYAAAYALEKGHIKTREEWSSEILTPRRIPTKPGTIMFPTAHDISPFYLEASLNAIEQMMLAGRNVVIVTKAHLECIKAICDKFTAYKKQLLIRITIGSMNEQLCKFWEPGAPSPSERLSALKYAFDAGYQTSVSMEPMLSDTKDAVATFTQVEPYVSEKIWLGKMNSPDKRVDISEDDNVLRVSYIKLCQSNSEIMKLYAQLKDNIKVAWKDSIMQVINHGVKK